MEEDETNLFWKHSVLTLAILDKLNYKNDQGYIFAGTKRSEKPFEGNIYSGNLKNTELITDKGIRSEKLLAPTFAMTETGTIIGDLESLIADVGNLNNLEKIDKLIGNMEIGQVKYGILGNNADKKIDFYKSMNISTEDIYESKYEHLEKYIMDLNNSILQYQAMASVVKKTENLSLVNYI